MGTTRSLGAALASWTVSLVQTGLDKFFPDKMDEGEKQAMKDKMEVFLSTQALKEDSDFRKFVLTYEGAANEVPKFVFIFRSLIRPAFTILLAYLDFIFFTGTAAAWDPEAIALLKAVNIIVLGFWFGERALQRSGIIDVLKAKVSKV